MDNPAPLDSAASASALDCESVIGCNPAICRWFEALWRPVLLICVTRSVSTLLLGLLLAYLSNLDAKRCFSVGFCVVSTRTLYGLISTVYAILVQC